jgi:hypothetical protein
LGFKIKIETEDDEFFSHLRKQPSGVFNVERRGYILFLAGEHDSRQIEWLKNNSTIMDSLTGTDIAFSIFAQNIRRETKIWIPREYSADRAPKKLGDLLVDVNDFSNFKSEVTKLVKGKHLSSGDELTAITYGTDIAARELNLIADLPCVVIMDPIPNESFHVYPMNEILLDNFVKILRSSIQEISENKDKYEPFKILESIEKIQNKIREENKREEKLELEIKSMEKRIARLRITLENIVLGKKEGDYVSHDVIRTTLIQNVDLKRNELAFFEKTHTVTLQKLTACLEEEIRKLHDNKINWFSSIFLKNARKYGVKSKLRKAGDIFISHLKPWFKPSAIMKILSSLG